MMLVKLNSNKFFKLLVQIKEKRKKRFSLSHKNLIKFNKRQVKNFYSSEV